MLIKANDKSRTFEDDWPEESVFQVQNVSHLFIVCGTNQNETTPSKLKLMCFKP